MELAQNQMLRFPENERPGDSQDSAAREDARLLGLVADGNQRALADLYDRRSGLLYSLLVRILGNEMEAQEIMQDTFLLIWKRAGIYDPCRSSPLAWMTMLARGKALDKLRARSRRSAGHAEYEREVASLGVEICGPVQAERDEMATVCAAALNELPQPQWQALQLAFFRGWTHQEIASSVGEPLGTVKARIRRGLLALRKALKDYHA